MEVVHVAPISKLIVDTMDCSGVWLLSVARG